MKHHDVERRSIILQRQAESDIIALGKFCTFDAFTPNLLGELGFLYHRKTKPFEEHLLVSQCKNPAYS
jgi:hypothetical protein